MASPETATSDPDDMVTPEIQNEFWVEDSGCYGTDANFFTEVPGTIHRIRAPHRLQVEDDLISKFCEPCSVRQDCLTYTLREGDSDGIWGGLTEEELVPLRLTYKKTGKLTVEQWNKGHEYRDGTISNSAGAQVAHHKTGSEQDTGNVAEVLPFQKRPKKTTKPHESAKKGSEVIDLGKLEELLRDRIQLLDTLLVEGHGSDSEKIQKVEDDIKMLESRIVQLL